MPIGQPDSLPGKAIGVVLTGGGARAAYQAGVLAGLLDILDPDRSPGFRNPFSIICGSSAGAINAAALGCRANDVHKACDHLEALWGGLHTGDVYHADGPRLLYTGLRWLSLLLMGWALPNRRNNQPRSLLDNSPLRHLLESTLDFERLQRNLDKGHLQSLAITATASTTGEHLTFYQSSNTSEPWTRSLRRAIPWNLGVGRLLSSSSIPFIFPAEALAIRGLTQWRGDGSMRQLAPMSPAIHLGSQKICVIGTGHQDDIHLEEQEAKPRYPSLAQI